MIKTKNVGDCPLLERLTNKEFLKILQHLSLEQYVLTQVFITKKKWLPLLDVNLETLQIKCCVCKKVRLEDVKDHVKQNDHLMLLRSKVKQFYHPFFTYRKRDTKLARGEDISCNMRKNALRELNMQIKTFKNELIFAKQFADAAERRSWRIEEEQLIEANLGKNLVSPDEMIVLVYLPFEDIRKLLFCVENNKWQTVFSYKNLTKKTTFHCRICSVNCCGIESLNPHLYGHSHNVRQLELYALCYKDSSKVNKNCFIQFGNSFSFSIKNYTKNSFRKRENIDYDSRITKLPNEVAKKFKSLNENAVKMFVCGESSMKQSYMNEDYVKFESYESNAYLGHLGVEYVLQITKTENDRDPKFECGLCEFFGDENKVQRHILSFEHKKKYLDLHYCDTVKKYESLIDDMCYTEFPAVMRVIVNKVSIEIEKHHSRSLPYTVSLAEYKTRRQDLITDIYTLLHASQIRGPSFSNVVSREEIRHLKNSAKQLSAREASDFPGYVLFTVPPKTKTYLNQMSHDPIIRMREYNSKFRTNRPLRTSRSISPIHVHIENRGPVRPERCHDPVDHHRTRSRSPIHERKIPLLRISDDISSSTIHDIWDIYRREIAHAANKIEIAYECFRKNPESHPFYEEEWNKFWQRRKKELEREGCDHRYFNFQPEWVQYFKQRIEVLFGEALHKSQIDIRLRLDIPLDAEEDYPRTIDVANQHSVRYQNRSICKVEEENTKLNTRQQSYDYQSCDPQNKRMCLYERKGDLNSDKSQMIISKLNDNHSNVIHVLRLMTALEEHLGCLGGKIMDLLSNALQLEKYYSGHKNKFESRILTNDNCNLLETAMEKLKGILFSGLLDEKKLSGFNRVIRYTANLLIYAEKMGWRQENNVFDEKDFISSGKSKTIRDELSHIQSSIDEEFPEDNSRKALSDTLMDLAKLQQDGKQQNVGNHSKQHWQLPVCPPPPNIQEAGMNNLFEIQIPNSGLASFNTKLSLDDARYSRTVRQDLPFKTEIGMQRKKISGRNNVYNNSFKYNNETRTNINTRTNNGTSSRVLISKIIPKMRENSIMYQGADGDE